MLSKNALEQLAQQRRIIRRTKVGSRFAEGKTISEAQSPFGPLHNLIGEWVSLEGHGWNMIALPYATPPGEGFDYRLLVNQYNEQLNFSELGFPIPNRGIAEYRGNSVATDQLLAGLQYHQTVTQIATDDFPHSGLAGTPNEIIHEEPGLWLHMTNEANQSLDIARLGTVPHGDSLLALGTSGEVKGTPSIPDISGLPLGVKPNLSSPYLAPYQYFSQQPFKGVFDPVFPNRLLSAANQDIDIIKATYLNVNTTLSTAGIKNIPFIVKQADATEMQFTFWIQELAEKDQYGDPKLRLQYSQQVFLDFFERSDGKGLIRWPHVSINTLVRKDQLGSL